MFEGAADGKSIVFDESSEIEKQQHVLVKGSILRRVVDLVREPVHRICVRPLKVGCRFDKWGSCHLASIGACILNAQAGRALGLRN